MRQRGARQLVAGAAVLATVVALPALARPGDPSYRSASRALRATVPCAQPVTGVQYFAPGRGRTVALTFDDGPGPTTAAIMDVLQREHVPATFFNLGVQARAYPGLVRREAAAGFAIGNHTWDHPVLPQLSPSGQSEEMQRESATQADILGSRPCLFRPPYGSVDGTTTQDAAAAAMSVWNWSVDTEDWKAQGSGASSWVQRIVSRAEAGIWQRHPVVLMHNQATPNPATLAALPSVIRFYRRHGYTFVDLYGRELLPAPPTEVPTKAGVVDLVVRRGGALYARVESRSSPWMRVGAGFIDSVAAAPAAGGSAVVVGRRSDGSLAASSLRGLTFGRWRALGGQWVGRPSVAVSAAGGVSVVARGLDDRAWLRQRVHGRWRAWQSLGGKLIADPSVAVTPQGLMVVGVDSSGLLVARRVVPGRVDVWHRLGARTSADPTLLGSSTGSAIVLAARGDSGLMAVRLWLPHRDWSRWYRVAGRVASSPELLFARGTLLLVATRRDGVEISGSWRGSLAHWTGWRRVS